MNASFSPRLITLPLIAASLLLSACVDKEEPHLESRVRPVKTVVATETPEVMDRRFAGGSQAAISSKLSFRTSGQIIDMAVKVGQEVAEGDLIAQLSDSDLLIKLERDEASYRQASAQAANSQSQYVRMQNLLERKLISQAEFDTAEANYRSTQAQVDQAEGSVALSRKQLSYTRLKSPADGCTVSEVHAEVNENVNSGQAIATLNCGTAIEVVAVVPESFIGAMSVGDGVSVIFSSLKNREFPGQITEIGSASSSNSAYPVTVRITNDDHVLRPGMAAEVSFRINVADESGKLWVPMVAVGNEGGQRFVYLYQSQGEERGLVKKQPVEIGFFTLEQVEVLSGLSAGDQVITAGLSQIYDGLSVKLMPEAKAAL